MAEPVVAGHAVVPGDHVERLSASGPIAPGPQEGILYDGPRFAAAVHRQGDAVERVIDLLVPATHLGATRIPPAGVREVAGVEVTLS